MKIHDEQSTFMRGFFMAISVSTSASFHPGIYWENSSFGNQEIAMPVNPSIGDAKRIAKASKLRRCVILFETDEGRVGYSSYGKTKELCAGTKEIMDEIFDDAEHRIHFDSSRLGL